MPMKPPFYRLTARCDNDRCTTDTFVVERKRVNFVSTSGQIGASLRRVCPGCGAWGLVINTEEVAA